MKFTIEANFVSPKKIQQLNRELRGKSYTPAVLSFPYYEKTEEGMLLGEVLICKPEARKLAKKNGVTLDEQINALIVHGSKHILGVHED
ncbi:MAG: rRNA maturation RNase YbeY [Patescibacteria group bacterium]